MQESEGLLTWVFICYFLETPASQREREGKREGRWGLEPTICLVQRLRQEASRSGKGEETGLLGRKKTPPALRVGLDALLLPNTSKLER